MSDKAGTPSQSLSTNPLPLLDDTPSSSSSTSHTATHTASHKATHTHRTHTGAAFYNRNGVILRETPQSDETFVEVEFKFLDLKSLNDQLCVSVAAMYLAFIIGVGEDTLRVDFVISAWSHQQCVLRAAALTLAARRRLVDAVIGIRARLGLVRRLADELFLGREDKGGVLSTNADPELERYRVTHCCGKAFVEAFAREFHK